jgi:hypothetical protein
MGNLSSKKSNLPLPYKLPYTKKSVHPSDVEELTRCNSFIVCYFMGSIDPETESLNFDMDVFHGISCIDNRLDSDYSTLYFEKHVEIVLEKRIMELKKEYNLDIVLEHGRYIFYKNKFYKDKNKV